jgi:hypothetical protein
MSIDPPRGVRRAGIGRLSAVCAWACLVLAVLLPAAVCVFWAVTPADSVAARIDAGRGAALLFPDGLAAWQRATGAALSLIPTGLMAWALVEAWRCLRRFAAGAFFARDAVRRLRGFARGLFWAALGGILVGPLTSLALTAANPPGGRALAISLGSDQLLGLLMAGILWTIAGAMAEAADLADENAQFV